MQKFISYAIVGQKMKERLGLLQGDEVRIFFWKIRRQYADMIQKMHTWDQREYEIRFFKHFYGK